LQFEENGDDSNNNKDNDDDNVLYNDALFDDEIEDDDKEDLEYYRDLNPSGKGERRPIRGGPQRPAVSALSEKEGQDAIKQYMKERRKYTDGLKKLRNKETRNIVELDWSNYSGVCSEILRPMNLVEAFPMMHGHTYPSKEICLIRIGEQSNLFDGDIMIDKSDNERIIAKSRSNNRFMIRAYKSDVDCWKVTGYNVNYTLKEEEMKVDSDIVDIDIQEGTVDGIDIDDDTSSFVKTRNARTPIKARWIVPLIKDTIRETPNMSNKYMKTLLSTYVKDKFLTVSLLQNARTAAIVHVFGTPTENVPYINMFVDELSTRGHDTKAEMKSAKEVHQLIKVRRLSVVVPQRVTAPNR
jgi:hypothetical protein